MIKCERCSQYYDENINKDGCPYCTVKITGGQGFFSKNTDSNSSDKTEVWNDQETELTNGPEIYTQQKQTNVKEDATVMVRHNTKANNINQLLVGWLVVIKGKGRGEDLRVLMGQNSIGRNENNIISINFGDTSISREKHAFIIYDPKHKKFMFKSGEGQNISYLNDEGVYSPMPIKNGDIIEIGETKLKFVQFVNNNFDWEI